MACTERLMVYTVDMLYQTLRLPLCLDDSTKAVLLKHRYQQTYFYNLGVELALDAIKADEPIPSNRQSNTYLTEMQRELKWCDKDSKDDYAEQSYRRAAIHQGLEAVRRHRSRRGRLEASIRYLKRDLKAAAKVEDKPKAKKLKRTLAKREQQLQKLLAQGTDRLYRTRKAQDYNKSRAVVLEEQARLVDRDDNGAYWGVQIVGKTVLPLKQPMIVEEGWNVVGSAQIVDCTKKVTRRTRPDRHQFAVHLQFKKKAPSISSPVVDEEVLGVDVGVAISVAASDGRNFHAADTTDLDKEIKQTQQRLSRCNKGSRRWKKHRQKLRRLERKRTNKREDTENQNTARLLDPVEPELDAPKAVAVESLNVASMKASAKGTVEQPGKNVAQKRGLNRSIHNARFGAVLSKIESGCKKRGIEFIQVLPAGTSQHCHVCERKGTRESQAVFRCETCGVFNADYNAAVNIRKRGWEECVRGGRTANRVTSETDQAAARKTAGHTTGNSCQPPRPSQNTLTNSQNA